MPLGSVSPGFARTNEYPLSDFVIMSDGVAKGPSNVLVIHGLVGSGIDLLENDKLFIVLYVHGDCRCTPGPNGRLGLAHTVHRALDVLGIEITATDNEEIFPSARDVELAVVDKAEVSGS